MLKNSHFSIAFTNIDDDLKDDLVLEDLDNTIDLGKVLENTQVINVGDINE